MSAEVMPDSRARHGRTLEVRHGVTVVPFYCASCGVEMGRAPDRDVMAMSFALCEPSQNNCVAKFGEAVGLGKVQSPEQIKFARFADAQLETLGHYVDAAELARVLDDVNHPLAILARELFPELR